MDSTLNVGKRLVALCREGKNLEAVNTLYAPDVVSIDAHGDEHMPALVQGIETVRRKNQWWFDNNTIHGTGAEGPYPHGDRFIVRFTMDFTPRLGPMAGRRMKVEEAALYTVRDGKIVQEEFFYDMGG
jgi:ketosteroid isomerase-like protein